MARHPSEQPTDVEMMILKILWDMEHGTARQIHDQISSVRQTNYSTTVKMLGIMLDKGLVKRDDSVRPQVFRSAVSRERTGARLVKDLVEKVYEGSAISLAMQALSSKRATSEEISKMRCLLDQMEKKNVSDE